MEELGRNVLAEIWNGILTIDNWQWIIDNRLTGSKAKRLKEKRKGELTFYKI